MGLPHTTWAQASKFGGPREKIWAYWHVPKMLDLCLEVGHRFFGTIQVQSQTWVCKTFKYDDYNLKFGSELKNQSKIKRTMPNLHHFTHMYGLFYISSPNLQAWAWSSSYVWAGLKLRLAERLKAWIGWTVWDPAGHLRTCLYYSIWITLSSVANTLTSLCAEFGRKHNSPGFRNSWNPISTHHPSEMTMLVDNGSERRRTGGMTPSSRRRELIAASK